MPPIVDVDVFNKVQDLLAFNQKAGAHKKAKVDYILFGKIFCGKCGAGMTGICGTSKQKVKHHYYIFSAKKKKLCNKRAVRQDWIETLVLKHLLRLVRNEELLEFIAENAYRVCFPVRFPDSIVHQKIEAIHSDGFCLLPYGNRTIQCNSSAFMNDIIIGSGYIIDLLSICQDCHRCSSRFPDSPYHFEQHGRESLFAKLEIRIVWRQHLSLA